MLLGIDGNEANISQRVGANVYAYELLHHLYPLVEKTSSLSSRIYLKDQPLSDLPKTTSLWQYKVFGPKPLWTQWRLPLELYRERVEGACPDIFYCPGHYAPRFAPQPTVITIMDLAFLHFKEEFKNKDLRQLTQWTQYSVKNAAHIFAISQATKNDIVKYYKINPKKVTVTYPGVNISLRREPQDNSYQHLQAYLGMTNPYLLFIGTLQPRKNIIRLIEAFAILKADKKFNSLKLVITGKKGWLYETIFEKLAQSPLQKDVIFTGFVSEYEKMELLEHAQMLVLPSLYEGFGIPVLEALTIGVPTVISRISSLPEVGGQAAEYIANPQSGEDIAVHIRKVLQLSGSQRQNMIDMGKEHAKNFNWKTCAQITLDTLLEITKKYRSYA